MLSSVVLTDSPGFSVATVRCAGHRRGWSAPEPAGRHQLVLVRSGRFRLSSNGHRVVADRTMGYLHAPGVEHRFSHPGGGDVCTAISLSPELWRHAAGDRAAPATPSVYIDGRVDLAHRRLLRSAPDTAFAMAEHLVDLLTEVMRQAVDRSPATAATSGAAPGGRGRALADAAREAMLSDHPDAAALIPLARLLDVSPFHLSRVFRRETGTTLTRYRNRVRIARALDMIEAGAGNLADVAAAVGFADQAHLARTVKAELGHTPTHVRALLAST